MFINREKQNRTLLLIVFFVPIVIAGLIRFWDLDLRPFHSDEGVNTHFLLKLYNKNVYHYNPANYHGPFLYYIGLLPFYVLGINDFAFRFFPAIFGIMTVALLYPFRRILGLAGLLTAGLFMAISPACSFFSRDTIHETYLIFFTLAVVVSFYLYYESKKIRYILFASASLAFTITVKETYILTFAVFSMSLAIVYLYEIFAVKRENCLKLCKDVFVSFGKECWKRKYTVIIGIVLFIFINILFYSSFFSYFKGVDGILSTLKIWTKTGTKTTGHAKPFIYYFKILYQYELPMLVLGICGFYYAFREKKRLAVFIASWTVLIYLCYSLIPYKTPWLILNILLPLSIMAGFFVNSITGILKRRWHSFSFYTVYVAIFGFSLYQSVLLNFVNYDDDRSELVYVQTQRDIFNLIDTIDVLAESCGKDMTINIVAKSYWPLPWYLRDYKNAKFWGRVVKNSNAPVIIADRKCEKELKKQLKGKYITKRFVIRPGVWLITFIQKGLYNSVYGAEVEALKQESVISAVTEDDLDAGLVGNYYNSAECVGKPFLTKIESDPVSFAYHKPSERPFRSPFGIEWSGYIHIKQKGAYTFATKSDDGSHVYIDGELIVDNGDFHAKRYISGVIFLTVGFHHIKVDYFDGGGGAVMDLLWTKPGQAGHEELIPVEVLYHKRIED